MRLNILNIFGLATLMSSTAAIADDAAVRRQPAAPSPGSSGFYVSMDGSSQTINLPAYDLGWKLTDYTTGANRGPSETYRPRVDGYGIAGSVGYVTPDGTFSNMWGSNVRFEIGASYIHADGTANGRSPDIAGFGYSYAAQMLNGGFGETNGFGSTSSTNSTLTTDYTAWKIGLKSAADHTFGAVTLTPSLSVFGGHASNKQSFFQQLNSGSSPSNRNYRANSLLGWTDWGARAGLDGKWQLASWLGLGLGGSVGTAWRDVSMNASDEYNHLGIGAYTVYSAAAGNQTTAPLLANAEASITVQPLSNIALKAFGGLNFDSRVPGMLAASFVGGGPTGVTPAGIKFASETSYYVGGRLTVGFNP